MKRTSLILALLLSGCISITQQEDTLHAAVMRNDSEAVQQLLRNGAAVDAKDANGLTPLMLACMNLQEENIRLLMRAGADPQLPNDAGTTARQMLNRGDSIPSRAPACRHAMQQEEQRR